jgi:hypothetical protein
MFRPDVSGIRARAGVGVGSSSAPSAPSAFSKLSAWFAVLALSAALIGPACGPVTPVQIDCSDESPCNGHGVCDDSNGTPVCHCDEGWTGAACDSCLPGYELDGTGECVPKATCESVCAAQGRTCEGVEGDIVCGDCLEGWYEEDGQCIEACAAVSNPGEIVPLDLYIMLDRSFSMSEEGKWDSVETALQSFVNSPDVAGIGVGLQFFPLPATGPIPSGNCSSDADCGLYGPCMPMLNQCNGSFSDDSCDPTDYEDAEVPIQTLPGVQSAFLSALSGSGPDGDSTPTQPAYEGAMTYATAWAQAHPDHLTFIVFATDGVPTNCTYNSVSETASLAADAAAQDPAVKTYVIGVEAEENSDLGALNDIAASGGTGSAYIVNTGGNVTQDFIDALNEIRANGFCKYQIPEPEGGGQVNYDKINVSVVDPADPSSAVTVPNVGDEAGCDPTLGGWYYDDPADPQMIQLCPVTCQDVQLNDLQVDILVGCDTVVL